MEKYLTEEDLLFILITDQGNAIFNITYSSSIDKGHVLRFNGESVIIPEPQKVDFDSLWSTSAPIKWSIGTSKNVMRNGTGFISQLNFGFMTIAGKENGNLVEISLEYKE